MGLETVCAQTRTAPRKEGYLLALHGSKVHPRRRGVNLSCSAVGATDHESTAGQVTMAPATKAQVHHHSAQGKVGGSQPRNALDVCFQSLDFKVFNGLTYSKSFKYALAASKYHWVSQNVETLEWNLHGIGSSRWFTKRQYVDEIAWRFMRRCDCSDLFKLGVVRVGFLVIHSSSSAPSRHYHHHHGSKNTVASD